MKPLALAAFFAVAATHSFGQTPEDVRKFDRNHNQRLDYDEALAWLMHKNHPGLAATDANYDGRLTAKEAGAYAQKSKAELDALRAKLAPDALHYQGRNVDKIIAVQTPPEKDKTPQRFFVRRDRLDMFQYRTLATNLSDAALSQPKPITGIISRADAKGANFSYSRNDLTKVDQFSINGRIAFIALHQDPKTASYNTDPRDAFSTPDPYSPLIGGYLLAPWLDAQGTVSDPKRANTKNTLQAGVDGQLQIVGGIGPVNLQYLTFTPYYQSDFDGRASIAGFRAGWEPVAVELNLGSRFGVPNQLVDAFWQLRAEVDIKSVEDSGYTDLVRGRYAWLGGAVHARMNLFPSRNAYFTFERDAFPALTDRLWLAGSYQHFWDAYSHRQARLMGAEIGYDLTSDGTVSLSFKVNHGKSKDTLERESKYVAGLNVKY